jgi:hypothetical protein
MKKITLFCCLVLSLPGIACSKGSHQADAGRATVPAISNAGSERVPCGVMELIGGGSPDDSIGTFRRLLFCATEHEEIDLLTRLRYLHDTTSYSRIIGMDVDCCDTSTLLLHAQGINRRSQVHILATFDRSGHLLDKRTFHHSLDDDIVLLVGGCADTIRVEYRLMKGGSREMPHDENSVALDTMSFHVDGAGRFHTL